MISASDACALGGASGASRHAGRDGRDRRRQDRPDFRQHPQPGRADLPGTVAHQRGELAHRPASRLARAGAAPQGGSGDGQGRAARGGLHLHAGSGHRLGRGGQGDLHRRAQGRGAPGAAHRPRQSPAGRAQSRRCWCRPTASKCWNAMPRATRCWRANWTASGCSGRPGRAGAACPGHGVAAPFDADALYRRSALRRALRRSRARRFRRRGGFRRHRRLCAQELRPLCAAAQDRGRPLAPGASAPGAGLSPQCRRHRRRPDGGNPAAIASGRPTGAGGRGLGQLEEYFMEQLSAGDTFVFAGDVLRFEGLREDARLCHPRTTPKPQVPSLQWRQVSAFHLPRPAGARNGVARRRAGTCCPIRCRNG